MKDIKKLVIMGKPMKTARLDNRERYIQQIRGDKR